MARLFLPHSTRDAAAPHWRMRPLDGPAHEIDADDGGWRATPVADGSRAEAHGALLLCAESDAGAPRWVLVADRAQRVRVNGLAVSAGVRVLVHRDELRFEGLAGRGYFSTEARVEVTAYDGAAGAHCPRCRLEIEAGQAAVQCPGCSVWHHQLPDDDLPCWTFDAACAVCRRSTALDGELLWVPA